MRVRGSLSQMWASTVLVGPALLLYLGFFVVPAVLGFAYSLTNWSGWKNAPTFIGLDNFVELFRDDRFIASIRFTLFETVILVVVFTGGALALAVLLDKVRKWKALIRGLFFYPYILSILVSGLLWQYMANSREGAVNKILRGMGLDSWAQNWMSDPAWAPWFITAMVVWSALGFFATIYLANLQTIPSELYEALGLESKSAIDVLRYIQIPMLRPSITLTSVMSVIFGINLFGQIMVTTMGAPGYRTFTVGYFIYWQGVQHDRQGYAAAASFVTFVVLLIVAALQTYLMRRKEVQL